MDYIFQSNLFSPINKKFFCKTLTLENLREKKQNYFYVNVTLFHFFFFTFSSINIGKAAICLK